MIASNGFRMLLQVEIESPHFRVRHDIISGDLPSYPQH